MSASTLDTSQTATNNSKVILWPIGLSLLLLTACHFANDQGRSFSAACFALFTYWILAIPIWTQVATPKKYQLFFLKYGIWAVLLTAGISLQFLQ